MIEMLLEMGIKDFRVLDAMSQVPRHIFLDEALRSRAYENRSLTIGYKQTISQPYIVARMTELLISHTKSRGKVLNQVLELGSGCGYQSAVLSYFCELVHAVGVICAAAPRQYPQDLIESLNVDSKIVIPVGNSKLQQLNVITKLSDKIEEDIYDEVAFVPMLPGISMDGNDSWVRG